MVSLSTCLSFLRAWRQASVPADRRIRIGRQGRPPPQPGRHEELYSGASRCVLERIRGEKTPQPHYAFLYLRVPASALRIMREQELEILEIGRSRDLGIGKRICEQCNGV